MSKFNKWTVLQNLDSDFVSNIKSVFIFGKNGKQVIVITNDDNVYAFGDNSSYGILGLGHTNAVQQPTKIIELCGKQVIQIEFGAKYDFVLSLTQNSSVYSWGYNANGELGNGNNTSKLKPTIITTLNDKKVIDIKTGNYHSLALTQFGDVFIWGHPTTHTPTKLTIDSQLLNIMSISSGLSHALALTNDGEVYYWGYNGYGQCGNGTYNHSLAVKWLQLQYTNELIIIKLVCGPNHSMLLSTKGNVYIYGLNSNGQCGDETKVNANIPTKLNINAKFIDIGSTKYYNISVGLTDTGFCYIWGQCGDQEFTKPIQIPCININEVIEYYSIRKVSLKPITLNDGCYTNSSIMGRISNKFNKRECSDISFKVEDKYIYVQKSYITFVCKHFETMFSDNKWMESNKSEIEIKDYSYNVYYHFLKYLYTDSIDIKANEDVMQLLDLANCYFEETLKQLCAKILQKSIKTDNMMAIYCSAVKYDLKEVKDYCIEFIQKYSANKDKMEDLLGNAVKLIAK